MSFSEWKYVDATTFCGKVTDGTHDSPKRQKEGKHLITSKHIKGQSIDFESAYLISKEDFIKINQRSKVDQWDVLISMIGEYCGYCYIEKNEFIDYSVKNVGIFKTKSELKAKWIYYYLNSTEGINTLKSLRSGTSQPYLSLGVLRNLQILVPNDEAQMLQIVAILSSLDDKIELNRQINQTLEAIAQTLFKEMCVPKGDELPEGWRNHKLGEIVEFIKGVSYRSSELIPSSFALVTLKSINRGGGLNFNGFKEFDGKYKEAQILLEGDIVIAQTDITQNADIVGCPAIVENPFNYKKLIASIDIVKCKPKENAVTTEVLFYILKYQAFKDYCLSHTNGSTVLHLRSSELPKYEFALPDSDTLSKFSSLVRDLQQQIQASNKEVQTLKTIRDSLLPKLMKGEIEIK